MQELDEHSATSLPLLSVPPAVVDLRLGPDGEHICFELNPVPAYTYFETHPGLPIGRALAELLIAEDRAGMKVHDSVNDRESH